VGKSEEAVNNQLRSLMAELEHFGKAYDSATTERSQKTLNFPNSLAFVSGSLTLNLTHLYTLTFTH